MVVSPDSVPAGTLTLDVFGERRSLRDVPLRDYGGVFGPGREGVFYVGDPGVGLPQRLVIGQEAIAGACLPSLGRHAMAGRPPTLALLSMATCTQGWELQGHMAG